MDNIELFESLRKLIYVDLNQHPHCIKNKIFRPFKVGYYDAYRKTYNDLLQLVKQIDKEKLILRKINEAVNYINSLPDHKIYKQNLNSKQPWMLQINENSTALAVFRSSEEIIEIAKLKGWQEPDLIPEGFELNG